jgi:FKBP-type peptidyl-prolyl cis-trans isomerase
MLRLAVVAVLATAMASCDDSPTAPTSYARFSQTDLVVGTGLLPAAEGHLLTVNYSGWLYDGSKTDNKGLQFDSSLGTEPFAFVLGVGTVIPGWDQGLVGVRAGGVRRLVIPPSLAYGPTRSGVIPANATLVFEVEVLNVEE